MTALAPAAAAVMASMTTPSFLNQCPNVKSRGNACVQRAARRKNLTMRSTCLPQAASVEASSSLRWSSSLGLGQRDTHVHCVGPQERNPGGRGSMVVSAGMKDSQKLLGTGKVKYFVAKEVGAQLVEGGGEWKLLDVRPIWEKEKAYVSGSLHVPLFIEDEDTSLVTLLKKQIQFGFGGWWLGQRLTKENEKFVEEVKAAAGGVDTPLILACGEGLRSMLALSDLYDAGFKKIAWLAGGFNSTENSDFKEVKGDMEIRFSTSGGVQGLLVKAGQFLVKK